MKGSQGWSVWNRSSARILQESKYAPERCQVLQGQHEIRQELRGRGVGLDQSDEKYGEVPSIHHIRHTWATRLGDSGATLAQLMAAGGWRTAGMAMRYMRRKETQAAEAAALLVGL